MILYDPIGGAKGTIAMIGVGKRAAAICALLPAQRRTRCRARQKHAVSAAWKIHGEG